MHVQTRRLQRRRERKKSGGGSGGKRRARGGRSGAGAGAGSRLVKAAPSGAIDARIAELHKTLPARLAAAPAPISSLIAARAGYAFKCYLIGLRRSWGPERPPPPPSPPRTRRAPGLLPPQHKSVFRVTDCSAPPPYLLPQPDGSPPRLGSFFCSLLPNGARGHSERHKSPEDA